MNGLCFVGRVAAGPWMHRINSRGFNWPFLDFILPLRFVVLVLELLDPVTKNML